MRVLFFPWGGGNGHVGRLLHIAREANEAGHSCAMAVSTQKHVDLVARSGVHPVVYPEGLISAGYWDRWTDPAYFSLSVEWDASTLRAFNANLAVHDGRPSVGSAAARFGIPVTSELQSLHLPGHRYAGRASEQIWTDMADSLGAGRLVDGRELLAVGGVGVPSVPQIDQVPKGFRGKVTYLGPLTGRQTPSGPTSPDGHRTLFYGVVPESDDVDAFLGAFADLGPSLSVAWGRTPPTRLARTLRAIGVDCLELASDDVLASCDSVVFHGGHGTTLLLLQFGLTGVVLPGGSPERLANAHALRRLGLAQIIETSGETSWAAHDAGTVRPDWRGVRARLDSLRIDESARAAAHRWRKTLAGAPTESPWTKVQAIAAQPRTVVDR